LNDWTFEPQSHGEFESATGVASVPPRPLFDVPQLELGGLSVSTANAGSNRNAGQLPPDAKLTWPLAADYNNELLWAPYRTAFRILLEAHHQTATMMQINRELAKEYLEIVHREQSLMHEAVEKILRRLAEGNGSPTGVGTVTSESFAEFYDSAVSSLRELAEAVTDAQSRSIRALQVHLQSDTEAPQAEAERKRA
jgi:hypothetical protein